MRKKQEKPAPIVAETTSEQIMALMLEEARAQTRYLKMMNTVLQLFGALLLLGIVLALCNLMGML